jgi:aconitate hydratase
MFIYDAAMAYQAADIPLIILAGKEYGTGSSRDWAAKGTALLGIKVVLAESYERIHRSNLVGMGVLPLQYREGENLNTFSLSGKESFHIRSLSPIMPRQLIEVEACNEQGNSIVFKVLVRLDNEIELEYYQNGGILPTVLKKMDT